MKKLLVLTLGLGMAVLAVISPVWAADVEGKIKAVTGRLVTLEDGTQLMIPPTVKVAREDLKPGADVMASYEEKGSQKIVTSIEVQPAKK